MKRRVVSAMGFALAVALGARPAAAQVISGSGDRFRSSKNFAFELRFAPFAPEVDAEFEGGKSPHERYFGKGRHLMTQVELDYQFFTRFGSAAIGASVGYFTQKGKAFLVDPTSGAALDARSTDDTRFSLYPTALMLVYRADQLWKRFKIPLIPYGKAGLNYTFWSVYDGNDKVASGGAVKKPGRGRGGTRGWQGAVGVSLVLDIIDPGSARELDSETGINHTHVFAEWSRYEVSGLGQSGRLNVGDTTWTAGLMFEF